MGRVLVVDDEAGVRTLLSKALSMDGHSVVTAPDGRSAIRRLESTEVDLVLLDLVMPGRDGLDVLRELRDQHHSTPVIVLSGVTDVGTRVQAFERGAIDVVAKPFSPLELLARVRRNLGNPSCPVSERYLTCSGVRLDLDRRKATVKGREVTLSEREFSLLAHLMRHPGAVCHRDQLLSDIWGPEDASSNVVDVCVLRLRRRLGPTVQIETVRGVGYCIEAA